MTTVTVCVGSSCHIKGARRVIMCFNELLKEHGLEDKVELKGSFCMERCGEGVNWQIDNKPLTSSSVEKAVKVFNQKVIKPIKKGVAKGEAPRGPAIAGRRGTLAKASRRRRKLNQ